MSFFRNTKPRAARAARVARVQFAVKSPLEEKEEECGWIGNLLAGALALGGAPLAKSNAPKAPQGNKESSINDRYTGAAEGSSGANRALPSPGDPGDSSALTIRGGGALAAPGSSALTPAIAGLGIEAQEQLRNQIDTHYDSLTSAADFSDEWNTTSEKNPAVAFPLPPDATLTPFEMENATVQQYSDFPENLGIIEENQCSMWSGDEESGFTKCSQDDLYSLQSTPTDTEKVAVLADRLAHTSKTQSVCGSSSICKGNLGRSRVDMPQAMDESVSDLANSSKSKDRARGKYLAENLEHFQDHPLVKAAVERRGSAENVVPLEDLWIPALRENGAVVPDEKITVRSGKIRASQNEIKAQKTFGIAKAYLSGWDDLPREGILCAAIVDDPNNPPDPNSLEVFAVDGHHRMSGHQVATSGDGGMNCRMIYLPRSQYASMSDFYAESLTVPGNLRFDLQDNNVKAW